MRLALLHTLLTVQPFLPIPKVGCENLAFTVCPTAYFLLIEKYAKSQPIAQGKDFALHSVGLEPTSPYLHDTAFTN